MIWTKNLRGRVRFFASALACGGAIWGSASQAEELAEPKSVSVDLVHAIGNYDSSNAILVSDRVVWIGDDRMARLGEYRLHGYDATTLEPVFQTSLGHSVVDLVPEGAAGSGRPSEIYVFGKKADPWHNKITRIQGSSVQDLRASTVSLPTSQFYDGFRIIGGTKFWLDAGYRRILAGDYVVGSKR